MNQGKIKLNAKLIYPSSFGHSLSSETLSPALAARRDQPGYSDGRIQLSARGCSQEMEGDLDRQDPQFTV